MQPTQRNLRNATYATQPAQCPASRFTPDVLSLTLKASQSMRCEPKTSVRSFSKRRHCIVCESGCRQLRRERRGCRQEENAGRGEEESQA